MGHASCRLFERFLGTNTLGRIKKLKAEAQSEYTVRPNTQRQSATFAIRTRAFDYASR